MNRRAFLRTAALTAAAAILHPAALFAGDETTVRTPKGALRGAVIDGGDCLRLNIWTPGPGHSN